MKIKKQSTLLIPNTATDPQTPLLSQKHSIIVTSDGQRAGSVLESEKTKVDQNNVTTL